MGDKSTILYECEVPSEQRFIVDDTPNAYRVECGTWPCICIVYGLYGRRGEKPRWHANVSCRWLVVHLLEQIASITADRDERAKQKAELFAEIERLKNELTETRAKRRKHDHGNTTSGNYKKARAEVAERMTGDGAGEGM